MHKTGAGTGGEPTGLAPATSGEANRLSVRGSCSTGPHDVFIVVLAEDEGEPNFGVVGHHHERAPAPQDLVEPAGGLLAFISAWPTVAFIGAAEMAIGPVRKAGQQVATEVPPMDTRTKIVPALSRDRDITNDELATLVGMSTGTVRWHRARLNGAGA